MTDYNREREAEIEKRVKRRIQRRMLLVLDFALFFVYGATISGRYYISDFFPVVGVLWFMGFMAHSVLVVYWEWSERAVRKALEQERNTYYRVIAETVLSEIRQEKPKRDQRLSLNDDGEFEDALDYDEREYRKRR